MNTAPIQELLKQAALALNHGDYAMLQQLSKRVLAVDRQQAEAWFFMSIVAEAGRQPGNAIQFVDRALQIDPDNVEYLSLKARYHSTLHQYAEAHDAASRAVALGSERAIVLDTLGVVLTRLGEFAAARELLARAVLKAPENPQFQFNLGSVEQFLGNQEAARKAFETAITLKPDFSRAHWALSEVGKNEQAAEHLSRLLELLDKTSSSAEDELYLAHAVSREYEKLGDFDSAFDYLERGKSRIRGQVDYSSEQDARLFTAMRQTFSSSPPTCAQSDALAGRAIFIVGMPRSGTTLVERILTAHSGVQSLGELQEFPRAVKQVTGSSSPVVLDAEVIVAAARSDMSSIARNYADMLANRIPEHGRFIDKLPLNFLYVGFLLAALPEAKVICLRRNPMDTILSNFRQLFALSFSYYNYHYDLADTARYFVEFQRLMAFWEETYHDRFYQQSYETLVDAPEQSIRGLLAHVGLPWEDACLEFHKAGGAVATASASQVRQPLYRSSIGRWRRYEAHLTPAKEILEANGIDFV